MLQLQEIKEYLSRLSLALRNNQIPVTLWIIIIFKKYFLPKLRESNIYYSILAQEPEEGFACTRLNHHLSILCEFSDFRI